MKKEEKTNLNNKQKEVLKQMFLKSKEDFAFYVKEQETGKAVFEMGFQECINRFLQYTKEYNFLNELKAV